jgi:hypothetical protein
MHGFVPPFLRGYCIINEIIVQINQFSSTQDGRKPWPCLDDGVKGVKRVKGDNFYLKHPNKGVKTVGVNVLPLKFPLPHLGCQIGVNFALTPPKSRSIIAPCICPHPASAPLPLVSDPLPPPPSRTARLHRSATADLIRRRRDDGGRQHRPRWVGPAVPFGGCLLRRLQLVLATGIHRRHAPPPDVAWSPSISTPRPWNGASPTSASTRRTFKAEAERQTWIP